MKVPGRRYRQWSKTSSFECLIVVFLAKWAAGTAYSSDECPLVNDHSSGKTFQKSSYSCGSNNSTSLNGQFFPSGTDVPMDNSTEEQVPSSDSHMETGLIGNFSSQGEEGGGTRRAKYAHLYPISDWKRYGWYDDDYGSKVNVYWMEFPPPSHEAHYAFALVYLILTVISLSGNVLVFSMIISFKELRTPSNYLVANLAVADFFMMSRGPVFIYNCLHFGPVTGYYGCQLYGVIGGMTGVGASMTLALIAKERYSVIVHPFNSGYKLSKTKAALSITFIWVYAAVPATIPLIGGRLGIKPFLPEGYLTSCSFDYVSEDVANRVFILCFFLAAWFVPFSVITTSYYKICRHVLNVSVTRRGQERQQRKAELRLAGVVMLVIAIWFLSWTPYATVALLGISGYRHLLTPFLTMVPAVFCKTAATIDPFLYALSHPRFREALIKIWCKAKANERRLEEVANHVAIRRSDGSVRFARKGSNQRPLPPSNDCNQTTI